MTDRRRPAEDEALNGADFTRTASNTFYNNFPFLGTSSWSSLPLEDQEKLRKSFEQRIIPNLSFKLSRGRLSSKDNPSKINDWSTYLNRDLLIRAIVHAVDTDDHAFSYHASQHKVSREVASKIFSYLKNTPSKVYVEISDRQKGGENITTERFVISLSEPVERTVKRPYYIEMGMQLNNSNLTEKQKGERIIEIAVDIGTDFAVLVASVMGLSAAQIIDLFKKEREKGNNTKLGGDVAKYPTGSRTNREGEFPNDISIIVAIQREYLFPKETDFNLNVDGSSQAMAAQVVRGYKPWSHADDKYFDMYESQAKAMPIAILRSAQQELAKMIFQSQGRSSPRQVTEALEKVAGIATTQVTTLYYRYQFPSIPELLDPKKIGDFIDLQKEK